MKNKTWKIIRWIITWIVAGALGLAIGLIISTKALCQIPTAIFCVGGFILLMMLNSWMDEWE